ncbi:MAG: hypothetical protein F6K00_30020 [Leptolyngbya sp. SIOISBB]|nr:hypothetical protein [Leptolyngbya sp. SIOISBB]
MTLKRSTSLLPVVLLCCLGVQILTLIVIGGQGLAIRRLHDKQPPSLVQMTDGHAIRVQAVAAEQRTPAVIKVFTSNAMTQLMNMSGTLPDTEGDRIQDPGIDIETPNGTAKVTSASMTASFTLAEDFRLPFLQKLAELTPPGVFRGTTQVVLIIDTVSEPEEVAPGKWQLKMLAHLAVFNGGQAPQQTIPFNREITVEATTAPVVPEGETPLEQAVYAVRQAGLMITDIRPLER